MFWNRAYGLIVWQDYMLLKELREVEMDNNCQKMSF